ncbi:MAG: hypothetical protein PHR21_08800, partial [Oscillospiraceae bacterium]|nr:hypothetical protein [Oscillospiraceae bacterium]
MARRHKSKHSLQKDSRRSIKANIGRFVAILLITALGAGFYAGLKATAPDMLATARQYYADTQLADFTIQSTYGLTDDDITALEGLDYVQDVMPTQSLDLLFESDSERVSLGQTANVIHLMALPAGLDSNGDYSEAHSAWLSQLTLESGRLPQTNDEMVVDALSSFEIGDSITLSATNDSSTLDLLAVKTFTVTGKAVSPQYITYERGYTNIGNGAVSLFAYVPASAFSTELYTAAEITVKQSAAAYTTDYDRS